MLNTRFSSFHKLYSVSSIALWRNSESNSHCHRSHVVGVFTHFTSITVQPTLFVIFVVFNLPFLPDEIAIFRGNISSRIHIYNREVIWKVISKDYRQILRNKSWTSLKLNIFPSDEFYWRILLWRSVATQPKGSHSYCIFITVSGHYNDYFDDQKSV